MAQPQFVLHLGNGRYVDATGKVTSSVPDQAAVLARPGGVCLDGAAVAKALGELAPPGFGADQVDEIWQSAGQSGGRAQLFFKFTEVATIIGGVFLSVAQPPALIAAVIMGIIISAIGQDDELSDDAILEYQRIRRLIDAQAAINAADVLLAMWSEIQGCYNGVFGALNDVAAHKPTGAARLAAFANMRQMIEAVNPAFERILTEDWIAGFDPEDFKSRFGLSTVLRRMRADCGWDTVAPQQAGVIRFDYRLGIPMLLSLAVTYPAMLKMANPLFRSKGTYRDRLRRLAGSIDGYVRRTLHECFAKTEHTGHSVFSHDTSPSMLYFGSPLGFEYGGGWGGWHLKPDSFPVGAFDLVSFDDGYLFTRWGEALGSGADRGAVGTFDYTWQPPAALADPVGDVFDFDKVAAAANARANEDYARLIVASGSVHMLLASALLRYSSAPPLRSETVTGRSRASRALIDESPTQVQSPVIFPVGRIEAPATLKRYDARNRVSIATQEPGDQPALRYRVMLRTIDSLFSTEAWHDADYLDTVWSAGYQPLAGDPQNLRLKTEFSEGRVLSQTVLCDGISPGQPFVLPTTTVNLRAHTFDWYVPTAESPWAQQAIDLDDHALPHLEPKTAGARSMHLRPALARMPLAAARVAPAAAPTLSYGQRNLQILASASELHDEAVSIYEYEFANAERRHVRLEDVTLDWSLRWQDGGLTVDLKGRPGQRSFQAFVVVEEGVQAGEAADVEWLHTPFAAELVNQLTLVPQSFFDKERRALEAGERLWHEIERRFAISAEPGPIDPIAAATRRARRLLRQSTSTATLSESLDLRFDALRAHRADLWQAAAERLARGDR
jgi:hypothetical protein